jgi:polysaccharide pyruvyl transferase WcaK-like protein
MRILLLGAAFNNPNLGVGALALGVLTCIAETQPEAEMALLDYAREPLRYRIDLDGRSFLIPTVNLRNKPYPANNTVCLILLAALVRLLRVKKVRRWAISRNRVLRQIDGSDLVLSIAGGDSFSDTYGFWRLLDVSLSQILVLLLGKRLVLLPQTLGPFEGRPARLLAKGILRRASVVYARDYESLEEAAAVAGGRAHLHEMQFCHDLGVMVSPRRPANLDVAGIPLDAPDDSPLVGLNVSGLLYMGGYRRNDAYNCRETYVEFVDAVADALIRTRGARVLLVPHNIGRGSESDSDICAELFHAWKQRYGGRIGFAQGQYTAAEMKYVIGRCDFFIGSRMHACIGALSQGVPAAAIAYSRKFIGVLATLGVPDLVLDPRTMPAAQLVPAVLQLYDRRGEARRVLEREMPAVKRQILGSMRTALNGASAVRAA